MIRRPPRSTQSRSSAASDVYKRQAFRRARDFIYGQQADFIFFAVGSPVQELSLIHISEPTRLGMISYSVLCLKRKILLICKVSSNYPQRFHASAVPPLLKHKS